MIYIGIDLGGTNVSAGIVDDKKGILYKEECLTLPQRPYKEVMGDIVKLCKRVMEDSQIDTDSILSVGIGIPGIETPEGLSHAKNLNWHGVTLRKDLTKLIKKPIYIDNDAHAAALGELIFGGLRGADDAVMLTLGTGVGGAVIVNKKILSGYNHAGGELGHVTFVHGGIQCACGRKGCLEQYASATALIRMGKEYAQKYPKSILHTVNESLENITAKNVVDGAKDGDAACVEAFEDYCEYLSEGIISFINMLNPQKVCLGGGLANAGDFLFEKVRRKCRERYFSPLHMDTQIVPAVLKNDAGILGAAMVAKLGE